ncbi:hypothetical protein F5887DRAFT_236096 [Amanita rubescens]|nr:hypothetical protein F5887DRAFT_236096 [Amanita rubescens]
MWTISPRSLLIFLDLLTCLFPRYRVHSTSRRVLRIRKLVTYVLYSVFFRNIITFNPHAIKGLVQSLSDDEVEEWKSIIQKGEEGLITLPQRNFRNRPNHHSIILLYLSFYTYAPYTPSTRMKVRLRNVGKPLYAKAISVVQTSGTVKSRMLTEVGKQIFTLPICLSTDPGYPPGDKPVLKFFSALPGNNGLSGTYCHCLLPCCCTPNDA